MESRIGKTLSMVSTSSVSIVLWTARGGFVLWIKSERWQSIGKLEPHRTRCFWCRRLKTTIYSPSRQRERES